MKRNAGNAFDKYLLDVQRVVETHGWAVQGVVPNDGEPGVPFAYTIGLIERGCAAEVLAAGLPLEILHPMLNQIATSMTSTGGMPPTSWTLPGGYEMKPVFLTRHSEPLIPGMAFRYYNTDQVPVVQYVWPSEDHFYPWDERWPHGPDTQPVGGVGRPLGWGLD